MSNLFEKQLKNLFSSQNRFIQIFEKQLSNENLKLLYQNMFKTLQTRAFYYSLISQNNHFESLLFEKINNYNFFKINKLFKEFEILILKIFYKNNEFNKYNLKLIQQLIIEEKEFHDFLKKLLSKNISLESSNINKITS
ncbi:hypothetical protein EV215_1446 [Hypnocyclicus thermotrophus]|uniref:Uncharacterized protein n=1 Tax=Hypnocyclicus thermotrophus TaxID=1627895 RepID=A0AA46DXT0_9FUSO|nr:hypothetical protein [Hypnocyclicus thermotrophus]TDT69104.1 hypothetical protein EV215_1446 [Hypnocyclicus thermotrophus]